MKKEGKLAGSGFSWVQNHVDGCGRGANNVPADTPAAAPAAADAPAAPPSAEPEPVEERLRRQRNQARKLAALRLEDLEEAKEEKGVLERALEVARREGANLRGKLAYEVESSTNQLQSAASLRDTAREQAAAAREEAAVARVQAARALAEAGDVEGRRARC